MKKASLVAINAAAAAAPEAGGEPADEVFVDCPERKQFPFSPPV
jgi:hypothetical protein